MRTSRARDLQTRRDLDLIWTWSGPDLDLTKACSARLAWKLTTAASAAHGKLRLTRAPMDPALGFR